MTVEIDEEKGEVSLESSRKSIDTFRCLRHFDTRKMYRDQNVNSRNEHRSNR